MKIKKFEDFQSSLHESYSYDYTNSFEGKSKVSKWMRSVANNFKLDAKEVQRGGDYGAKDSGGTVDNVRSLFPMFGRLIFGAGAAVADFFSLKKDGEDKVSKKELKSKKEDLLDDWEEKNLKGKAVTQKDAEDFYKSGVLKGRGYFGSGFDPLNPKNQNEKEYSSYLGSAMSRYYGKIKK
jgi:hypothetical protein